MNEISITLHTSLTPALREVIGALYQEVRAPLLDHPNYRLDVFLDRLDRHGVETGFGVAIAHVRSTGSAVGYAYGNGIGPGDRWWRRMTSTPPPRYATRDAVAIKEIGVIPDFRGTGVSRRMHDALLETRPEPHVTLMVNPAAGDGKVQKLYEGWGYAELGIVQPSPESPWLVCMGRAVRTPA
ncbi:GNAT family N-acetyltransferase [Streptomyces sp. NPDC048606]|uniref:GNAT family N-acetyltransferase n=1 Tax=Streptomyces sp. NPDC048606 TaxID=3154726 RepID=UPI0034333884